MGGETESQLRSRIKAIDISRNKITSPFINLDAILNSENCLIDFDNNIVYSSYNTSIIRYGYNSHLSSVNARNNDCTTLGAFVFVSTLDGYILAKGNKITLLDNGSYNKFLYINKHGSYVGSGTGVVCDIRNNTILGNKIYMMDAILYADVDCSNNTFICNNLNLYYSSNYTTVFKKLIITNNEFTIPGGSLDVISTNITNTNRRCSGNTINGLSQDIRTASPTDNISKHLYANGQIVTNSADATPSGWRKVSDTKWNVI